MTSFTLRVLDVDISFKAKADQARIDKARELLESRFSALTPPGSKLSKEKLLIYLALSLADDYLQSRQKLDELDTKLTELTEKIDQAGKGV